MVIILADCLNMTKEDVAKLRRLARKHVVLCAVLLQPGEAELPAVNGMVVYEDALTGEINHVPLQEEARQQYRQRYQEKLSTLTKSLKNAGCRFQLFVTSDRDENVRVRLMTLFSGRN